MTALRDLATQTFGRLLVLSKAMTFSSNTTRAAIRSYRNFLIVGSSLRRQHDLKRYAPH